MKCPKCGKLLQAVFAGIAMDFKNPIDADGLWLVCNNPDCPDGKLNCAVSEPKDIPF